MTELGLYIQRSPDVLNLITIRVLEGDNEFLTEAASMGYEIPKAAPEKKGMSFQLECSKTGDKSSLILLNLERVDIETIAHEVRHGVFWAYSNRHGEFKLNLLDKEEDEIFNTQVDTLVWRAVCSVESEFGIKRIPYRDLVFK